MKRRRNTHTPVHVCPCRSQWGDPVHEVKGCTGGSDLSEVSLDLHQPLHHPLLPHHNVSTSPCCPADIVSDQNWTGSEHTQENISIKAMSQSNLQLGADGRTAIMAEVQHGSHTDPQAQQHADVINQQHRGPPLLSPISPTSRTAQSGVDTLVQTLQANSRIPEEKQSTFWKEAIIPKNILNLEVEKAEFRRKEETGEKKSCQVSSENFEEKSHTATFWLMKTQKHNNAKKKKKSM